MGQKVNPNGLRVGVIKNWDSRWFAKDNVFGDLLVEDYEIRKDLKKRLYDAGVPAIEIERKNDEIKIMIQCARPGMVVGRGGEDIKKLEEENELLRIKVAYLEKLEALAQEKKKLQTKTKR